MSSRKAGQVVKKRVFIGLLLASLFLLTVIAFFAWWLFTQQTLYLNRLFLVMLMALAFILFVLLAIGLLALIWSLWSLKEVPPLENMMRGVTKLLFPVALWLGKWLGVAEEKIKNSYIQVSNQLVKTQIKTKTYQRIMILAPHCLQWVQCPHKITIRVENCKRCGQCVIMDLLALAEETGTCLKVVTGGTLARKMIKEYRPDAVVAIACERDLVSGMQDVDGLPIIGIVNERPEGPCANTKVDLRKVREAIGELQT